VKFTDVIGQSSIKDQLIQIIGNERIPHAQIFLGPKGCGKLALAIAFAQYVLCENKQGVDSCGRCISCIKVSKLIHPDVHYSYPTVGTKMVSTNFIKEWKTAIEENPYMDVNQWLSKLGEDNKQGNITKDECESIVKKLSLKTFEGKYKILIMWLPEYLGKEGNRLLKLIEEPPEDTLFVLVAEQVELILNTILSRCQLVKMNALSDEEIQSALIEKQQIDEERAFNAARLANGDYNEALRLLHSIENDNAAVFLDWFRICYQGKGEKMVEWVEQFAQTGREGQKQLIIYALHFLREFLALKMIGDGYRLKLQAAEAQTAKNMVKVLDYEQVNKMMELFNNVHYYIERNANGKILFLDTSIRLHKIFRKKY
jgi:DNA polymerase III subunit delta'